MVIECSSCRARYRMNPSILKGFQGAEVRCRKCGGKIVILMSGTPSGNVSPASGKERADGRTGSSSPEERAGDPVMRAEPSPERIGRRPQTAETKAHSRAALAEEANPAGAVPENVFSLDLFREARPKKGFTAGFDISGAIHSEPAPSLEDQEPPRPSPQPLIPPPENRESEAPSLLDKPIQWKNEGIISSPGGHHPPSPDQQRDFGESILRRSPFKASFSNSVSPRPSHIAMVYLFLLFLGGCGYLIIHLLSGMLNGGGK